MHIGRSLIFTCGVIVAVVFISCGENSVNSSFDSILDLYEQYDVVHLGERHWNMTDYNFRIGLVNYPRFAEIVDDIVIESGNYLYQDILDKYILELEDVPRSDLQKVWRNTVVTSGVWDATIYKEFVYAVREVNERLPLAERIRLIAAEPPIDWNKVNTADEWMSYFCQRSTHTPRVIKSEVIDKGRKAFVIYGGAHFFKSHEPFGTCTENIRINLEKLINEPIFSILPMSGNDQSSMKFQEVVGVNDIPHFINLKTSELSNLDGNQFFAEAFCKLGEFTDGIIFFGTESDEEAEYDPEAANDSSYQVEYDRRRSIVDQWW
jgi:hypothetical protein